MEETGSHQILMMEETGSHQILMMEETGGHQILMMEETGSHQILMMEETGGHRILMMEATGGHQILMMEILMMEETGGHQILMMEETGSHQILMMEETGGHRILMMEATGGHQILMMEILMMEETGGHQILMMEVMGGHQILMMEETGVFRAGSNIFLWCVSRDDGDSSGDDIHLPLCTSRSPGSAARLCGAAPEAEAAADRLRDQDKEFKFPTSDDHLTPWMLADLQGMVTDAFRSPAPHYPTRLTTPGTRLLSVNRIIAASPSVEMAAGHQSDPQKWPQAVGGCPKGRSEQPSPSADKQRPLPRSNVPPSSRLSTRTIPHQDKARSRPPCHKLQQSLTASRGTETQSVSDGTGTAEGGSAGAAGTVEGQCQAGAPPRLLSAKKSNVRVICGSEGFIIPELKRRTPGGCSRRSRHGRKADEP
ncbi:unnamed protein product [Ranitomeya imitator]|uniref:Uncharacterized protein n=1 Tax=Ranitomeya imitator TaxID=111125 RepID=A0ABN9LCP4_9NEOB|nr:unnamed protein product [Ranitomeya imitator]